VWNDTNGNGLQDEGPGYGINGVVVNLYLGSCEAPGILLDTAVTAGDGGYEFSQVPPGTYCVDVDETTLPAGYEFLPGAQSGPEPHEVSLAPGEDYTDADFGYVGRGTISGIVWHDRNENGQQDLGEEGLSNVTVCLYEDEDGDGVMDPEDDLLLCTATGPDGEYLFSDLWPGTYIVVETDPEGYFSSTPNILAVTLIVVGPSGSAPDNNFGDLRGLAALGDFAWEDWDKDGVQDAGETVGVPGVPITVTNSAAVVITTTTTDANGYYLVTGLVTDTYTVTAGTPPGWILTSANPLTTTLGFEDVDLTMDFGFVRVPPCPFCPDWVVFHSNRDGNWELYQLNAGGLLNLTRNPATDLGPTSGPESSLIAFQSDRDGDWEIYVMDADGDNQQQLTHNTARDTDPVWSPACSAGRIAFQSDRDGNWEIYIMNADGSGQQRLTEHPAADVDPFWSPDGRWIAFQSHRDGRWQIYALRLSDLHLLRLTNSLGDDVDPVWSPDGQWISFRSNRDGFWKLYLVNPDGTEERQITTGSGNDRNQVWSPDGSEIAFQSDRDGRWEIYVVSADGSQIRRLTQIPGVIHEAPTWSCDGHHIIAQALGERRWQLVRMRAADGGDYTALTGDLADNMYPMWMPPEEDGSLALERLPIYLPLLMRSEG